MSVECEEMKRHRTTYYLKCCIELPSHESKRLLTMQLGFLPRKGTTVPREVSEPWSLAVLPSRSGPLDNEHRSPVTFTLPKPQGIRLLDQKGSTPHQLQLLGSKVFRVVRVDLAGYLGCESPPGWVTNPQAPFPPKAA